MKCQQCQRKNSWQAEFCSGCGQKLQPPAAPLTDGPETGAESWRWVTVWTVVLLLVVGGLCYLAFKPDNALIDPANARHGPDPAKVKIHTPR